MTTELEHAVAHRTRPRTESDAALAARVADRRERCHRPGCPNMATRLERRAGEPATAWCASDADARAVNRAVGRQAALRRSMRSRA